MVYNNQNHGISGLCPSFGIQHNQKTTFRKLVSLGLKVKEERHIFCWIPVTDVISFCGTQQSSCVPLLTGRRKQIQFPKRCVFYLFRIPDDGQSPQTK
jgi:hypothetical protein